MLEMGRQTRGVRTKVLPQPFAYGVADRSAGLAIDLFAVDSAVHGRFCFLVISNAGNAGSSHRDGNCFAVLADCVRFGKRLIETLLVPPDRQNKAPARGA